MDIFYKAWDVPNSNLIITRKERNYVDDKIIINIEDKISNKIYLGSSGRDEYEACEKMIGEITQVIPMLLDIYDNCNANIEIKQIRDWWNFPKKDDNFVNNCIIAMLKLFNFKKLDETIKPEFIFQYRRSEDSTFTSGYCVCVKIRDNVLFKAPYDFNKDKAFNKFKMTLLGAGAVLEKIQNGAWNVMIDSSKPEYELNKTSYNKKIIKL